MHIPRIITKTTPNTTHPQLTYCEASLQKCELANPSLFIILNKVKPQLVASTLCQTIGKIYNEECLLGLTTPDYPL